MSEAHSGAVGWLSLAAAPTFAIMALTTGILGGGPGYMICHADHAALLDGMAMYLLMRAFHSPPWLTLISGRSRRSIQSRRAPRTWSVKHEPR